MERLTLHLSNITWAIEEIQIHTNTKCIDHANIETISTFDIITMCDYRVSVQLHNKIFEKIEKKSFDCSLHEEL